MPYNRLWRLDVGMRLYTHKPHPHILNRKAQGPVKVNDARPKGSGFTKFNSWLGLKITMLVGTMVCAYVFGAIALLSLPSAISSHNLTVLIAWISSNFIQLVLLPIIIVGQNVQAKASDKRSEQTYNDAEAVLSEALKIQEHLAVQDDVLTELRDKTNGIVPPDPANP